MVKPKIVENAVFQELVFNKSDYEAYLYSVGSGPDPLAALKCFHSATPHSACNYVDYANPGFDRLIEEAVSAHDEPTRVAALKRANAFLTEEAPVWFFDYNKAVLAYQPWILACSRMRSSSRSNCPKRSGFGEGTPRAGMK